MGSASRLKAAKSTDGGDLKGKKPDRESAAAMNGKGNKSDRESAAVNGKGKKRTATRTAEESTGTRKMPKRSAACSDFKEKSVRISSKDYVTEKKDDQVVEEEPVAVRLTAGSEIGKPMRKLTEFVLHNSDGIPQSFEMLEVDDIFISGLILPFEEVPDKKNLKGIKCEGFGRVESWAISGYEDGVPVVWLATDIADYDCIKPSGSYKKFYDHFFAKATACIEVYKKLSKSSGGNPDTTLDELLGGVVRVMSGMKCFSHGASVRDFIISQGQFIYNQLVGLDETSETDQLFLDLPVLLALKDEKQKQDGLINYQQSSSGGSIKIGPKASEGKESGSLSPVEEDEDLKLARLLQEEQDWNSKKQKKGNVSTSSLSKFYIKINEDEIANDYPLPAYYTTSNEETDEYVVFDSGIDSCHIDDLPRSMLHNWALYNSDSRLISLELLPMKPCADIDVTIFGSGVMTGDDGSGYHLDADSNQSSSGSSSAQEVDGMPIYLSSIKEWMIEFGSSMVFVSIRTDMAWYRLGKPSKQYAPWYEPVLKTARLAITIITLLKDQSRVARLSFADVIKKVSEIDKNDPAFISSNPAVVERYVVVHGQIILQQFAEFPDQNIKKSGFATGLANKMEERHHTKWLMKTKKILQRDELNLNPRAAMGPVVSKRKAMQATTTKLINRIWGEYYSNYSPEVSNEVIASDPKEDEENEEQEENEENDEEVKEADVVVPEKVRTPSSSSKQRKSLSTNKEIRWKGKSVGKTSDGFTLYKQAIVNDVEIEVGAAVLVDGDQSEELSDIYFVEYMFEKSDGSKMFHGRLMQRGTKTFLGNTISEREVFLVQECMDFELVDAKETLLLELRNRPWGYQYRRANIEADKNDRARADERKSKGLPAEYYCRSLYSPEEGGFFALPTGEMGMGSGFCSSCKLSESESKMEVFEISKSRNSFVFEGNEYSVHDFIYLSPYHFDTGKKDSGTFKGGRNVGLKAYVIAELLEIIPNASKKADATSTQLKVRRFFRPEDISEEKAYSSDIREVYYSEETHTIPLDLIEGKCEVRKKCDLPVQDVPALFEHVFFCEHMYDPSKGSLKQLPSHIKLKYSAGKLDNAASRKRKGKSKEGENDLGSAEIVPEINRLVTLDIFAGCGGLSEGLHQSGVSTTKWAIEYEEPAGEAFRLNHPDSLVFINNCNVILRAVMQKCGDIDDCISTPEAAELEAKLDKEVVDNLPLPGQVDFINGGPPCQGFSGMNRFNQSTWSKVQCEMILGYLSFADIYRPRFFLLENVRNFVSFNQGQTFKLTVASLLEMGYQVRFGILEAGTFGVPQTRKRAFIWAASPEETLPKWPEPMHVFSAPELKIKLEDNTYYAAARSTANGAPFRALTVRDTIGDLPPVNNGASKINLEYKGDPVSFFQKTIRGNAMVLSDHIAKEMNELNLMRCKRIPRRAGADWRDLPDEKVTLSNGQVVDLIPWCLPNTAKRHNQWKGLFGRLDWDGNFPTSITDPQPMGKVGMCFHPEEDRIVTVRECARSQGFPDSYKFYGNILSKHRQIGNAVPPPLAYALGRKLKEALENKKGMDNK